MGERTQFLGNLLQPHPAIVIGLLGGLVPRRTGHVFRVVTLDRIDLVP